jgi:hypothetical protein
MGYSAASLISTRGTKIMKSSRYQDQISVCIWSPIHQIPERTGDSWPPAGHGGNQRVWLAAACDDAKERKRGTPDASTWRGLGPCQ